MTRKWESRSPRFRQYVVTKLVLSGVVALVLIAMWFTTDIPRAWPFWALIAFAGVVLQWQNAKAHTSVTRDCIVASTGWRTFHVSQAKIVRLEPREFKNDVVLHRREGRAFVLPCLTFSDAAEAQDICTVTLSAPAL